VTEKDTQYPSANVALERLLEMAREAGLPKSEAVNQAHTTPSGVRPQIEVVADLLMAARMACSDLPPDARSALRTLLRIASRELSDVPTATRLNLAAKHEPDAMGDRDEAPSQMTPDEIAEAQRMAREWRPRNRPL